MNVSWTTVLALLQLIVSAVKPELKAAALAELKSLDSAQTNPLVKLLIEEAETIVQAA